MLTLKLISAQQNFTLQQTNRLSSVFTYINCQRSQYPSVLCCDSLLFLASGIWNGVLCANSLHGFNASLYSLGMLHSNSIQVKIQNTLK